MNSNEHTNNDLFIKRELVKIHKRNKETLEFMTDVYMSQFDISEHNARRMQIILKQQVLIEEYISGAIRY
jgi:hypothetical protein